MTINEIIGRALVGTLGDEDNGTLLSDYGNTPFDEIGAAVVKALGEAGYAVVPREPTKEMLESFSKSNVRCNCDECATVAWSAMMEAAPQP